MSESAHERWMREAIAQAEEAERLAEVPIGCAIVHDATQRIIGRAYNRREVDHDPTAHAEMVAIREASRALGHWRLLDCTLYVTLEPCPMCAGAIVLARIPRVVYGAADPKAGAARTLFQILDDPRLNHRADVIPGVLGDECGRILSEFFARKRTKSGGL